MEFGLQLLLGIVKMIDVILDACCMRTHETMFLNPKHKYIVKATKQRHARVAVGSRDKETLICTSTLTTSSQSTSSSSSPAMPVHTSHSPLSHARIKLTCPGAQLSHVGTSDHLSGFARFARMERLPTGSGVSRQTERSTAGYGNRANHVSVAVARFLIGVQQGLCRRFRGRCVDFRRLGT